MTSVVVFGATGATGRLIVDEAVRAGHTVTAAARRPEAFPHQVSDALRVVQADVLVPGSVRSVITGHEAVISAIGPAGRRADSLYSTAARNLVTAMSDVVPVGPRRIVVLSSAGARRDDPHHAVVYRVLARTVMKELYDDMRAMEAILQDSPVDWTVVRPGRIVDEPAGAYEVLDGLTPRGDPSISRADLAGFVVDQVDDTRWSRRLPTLARGPHT